MIHDFFPGPRRCAHAVRLALCACAGWAGAAAQAETHTVVIEAMRYEPEVIEVRAGDTVVWQNRDPFPHTVTAAGRRFDSGEIGPQRAWKFTVLSRGEFAYVCALHPTMQARLVVR